MGYSGWPVESQRLGQGKEGAMRVRTGKVVIMMEAEVRLMHFGNEVMSQVIIGGF